MIASSPSYYESVSCYGGNNMKSKVETNCIRNSKYTPTPYYIDRVFAGRRSAEEWISDVMRAHGV